MKDSVTEVIERSRCVRAKATEARSRFIESDTRIEADVAAARERREYWRCQREVMWHCASAIQEAAEPGSSYCGGESKEQG